jgi:hypothetical protein
MHFLNSNSHAIEPKNFIQLIWSIVASGRLRSRYFDAVSIFRPEGFDFTRAALSIATI